jgi:hypothetical protein
MAVYTYDDFRITFSPRGDGAYDVRAVAPGGVEHRSVFTVPLPLGDLQAAVVHMAKRRSRAAHPVALREVAPAAPETETGTIVDAEDLGAALANALFVDGIGVAYDAARQSSERAQRGLRLTLSLESAPALLSLPWEFLYRRPRFIASQRHTPLVRCLDSGSLAPPPAITDTVRILGVVSSPKDLAPLDVEAERRLVEVAVSKMVTAGRVELDWLDPATPRCLREALRDSNYHILHYVGHSSFTAADQGAIYLQDQDGNAVEVDDTMLANLLSDQDSLRLVVLNSCDGARTTLNDPYAGVATTLIQLGVPAVVAMQFEISDRAAILFADELYTNLIGRQDPIDAAVGEARKAIYVEIDRLEWATPVVFVRDPDVQLFDFKVPVAPLPPPAPPDSITETDNEGNDSEEPHVAPTRLAAELSATPASRSKARPRWAVPALAAAVAFALVAGVAVWFARRSDGDAETAGPFPRSRSGDLSVQIREPDGETHLYQVSTSGGAISAFTTRDRVVDTQAVWQAGTNRVAFTRERAADGPGSGVFYVVPGVSGVDPNAPGVDKGKQVVTLVPRVPGAFDHFPAWTGNDALFYFRTNGCAPAAGCRESMHVATFTAAADDTGFLDALTIASDQPTGSQFIGVTAVAADPSSDQTIAVADAEGLWVFQAGRKQELARGLSTTALSFTADGQLLLALGEDGGQQKFSVFNSEGKLILSAPAIDSSNSTRFVSITPDSSSDGAVVALSVSRGDGSGATLTHLALEDGRVKVAGVLPILTLSNFGVVQAAAL